MKYFLILGPPGAGKTTQGKLLSSEKSLAFIETGSLLREIAKSTSPIRKDIKFFKNNICKLTPTLAGWSLCTPNKQSNK